MTHLFVYMLSRYLYQQSGSQQCGPALRREAFLQHLIKTRSYNFIQTGNIKPVAIGPAAGNKFRILVNLEKKKEKS